MNVFFLTLLFITAAPYADADTIFNEKTSFNTAKAVKLGRGGGISGWTNATIVTATRAVDADKACMAHCAACNTKQDSVQNAKTVIGGTIGNWPAFPVRQTAKPVRTMQPANPALTDIIMIQTDVFPVPKTANNAITTAAHNAKAAMN